MTTLSTRLSKRETSSVLVVAAVIVAFSWFGTGVQGTARIVTAGLAGVVAAVVMAGALAVID